MPRMLPLRHLHARTGGRSPGRKACNEWPNCMRLRENRSEKCDRLSLDFYTWACNRFRTHRTLLPQMTVFGLYFVPDWQEGDNRCSSLCWVC